MKATASRAKRVGQVALVSTRLLAAVDRAVGLVVGFEVGVGAGQEAEELVEAAVERVELVLLAQVPLADQAGGVAGVLQPLGDGRLRRWAGPGPVPPCAPAAGLNSWPKRCW